MTPKENPSFPDRPRCVLPATVEVASCVYHLGGHCCHGFFDGVTCPIASIGPTNILDRLRMVQKPSDDGLGQSCLP